MSTHTIILSQVALYAGKRRPGCLRFFGWNAGVYLSELEHLAGDQSIPVPPKAALSDITQGMGLPPLLSV